MLLTDDEEWKLWNAQGIDDMNQVEAIAFARAYAAAILAKLASAELPEPEKMPLLLIGAKHSCENVGERSFTEADFHSAAIEIFKLGQSQAFAQGAASQLAEKPSAWSFKQNRVHRRLTDYCPPDDAYDKGTLVELFTLKEPK